MNGIIQVSKGLEEVAVLTLKNTGITNIQIHDGYLTFDITDYKTLCQLSYTTQIALRVLLEIEDIEKHAHLIKGLKFRIDSNNKEDYKHAAQISKYCTIDLKDSQITFSILEEKLCLDFSGDLSKRDYRIFNHPMSLKGTTAFGFLMLIGYRGEGLLDMFCNSGVICIEAALYANKIPHKRYAKDFPFTHMHIEGIEEVFQKEDKKITEEKLNITAADPLLRNITAAKKNAKIAGVEKYLEFRRIDTDWMDVKFDDKSIQKMVTFMPGSTKDKRQEKLYTELFYQAEYILKDKGQLCILCIHKDALIAASKKHFIITMEKSFHAGAQKLYALIFVKVKK